VLASSVSSSVIQSVFGHLSDARSLSWLLPAGVALAAAGIALAGWPAAARPPSRSWWPAASGWPRTTPRARGAPTTWPRRGAPPGLSLFSVGGNAGFALGPIIVTPLALAFGLAGTPLVAVLPLAVSVLLWRELRRPRGFEPVARDADEHGPPGARDQVRPFVRSRWRWLCAHACSSGS
jgi:FSR family fosmidomycin resistance protein-like MFS transporter